MFIPIFQVHTEECMGIDTFYLPELPCLSPNFMAH